MSRFGTVEVAEMSLRQAREHRPLTPKQRDLRSMNIEQISRWLKAVADERDAQSQRPGS